MTVKELIDIADENLGIVLYSNNQTDHNPKDTHYRVLYPKEPIPKKLKKYLNYTVIKIEHHWDECIVVTIENPTK